MHNENGYSVNCLTGWFACK